MTDEPTFGLNYVKALQDEITRERDRALEAEQKLREADKSARMGYVIIYSAWNDLRFYSGVFERVKKVMEDYLAQYRRYSDKEYQPLPIPPDTKSDYQKSVDDLNKALKIKPDERWRRYNEEISAKPPEADND